MSTLTKFQEFRTSIDFPKSLKTWQKKQKRFQAKKQTGLI